VNHISVARGCGLWRATSRVGTRYFAIARNIAGSVVAVSTLAAQSPAAPHIATPTDDLPAQLSEAALHPIMLLGAQLLDDPIIGRPLQMAVNSDILWIGDGSGSPFLHVVDVSSGKLVRSFGRHGAGPGDFQYIMMFSLRPGDAGGVWVDDGNLRRLTRVTEGARQSDIRVIVPQSVPVQGAARLPSFLRIFWVSRDRLALIGATDTDRIMFADTTGHIVSVRSAPLLGTAQLSDEVRMDLSQGVAPCARPTGDRFAIAYYGATRIDLFDATGSLIGRFRVPIDVSPNGDVGRDTKGNWHAPKPRWYYRDCAATRNRLYALFSGRLRSVDPGAPRNWDAQFVHVFDWSGRFLGVLQLDQFAESIAVEGDSVLYAGGDAIEGVVRYRIPPSLRTKSGD
jgi:TolB-like 6-blade propeller-like